MLQIFVIVGPEVLHFTTEKLHKLGERLFPVVEAGFGIQGTNTAFTAVRAEVVKDEADVQVEIRYMAGRDEYNQGQPFDPALRRSRK